MNKSDVVFETLYKTYPALLPCRDSISAAFLLLKTCANNNALILACGNGGSASDCEHIVGELMKGFNLRRPLSESDKKKFDGIENGSEIACRLQKGIRAISLTSQGSLISAFANDVDPALIFAQQVFAYAADPADVLIALSTSGNSQNVVNAVKTANAAGIKSIAITGEKESMLSLLASVTIKTPATSPYEVQEYTLPVYHALCAALEAELFTE